MQIAALESTIEAHELSKTKQSVEIEELKGFICAGDEKLKLSEALGQQKDQQIDTYRECVAEVNQELKLRDVTLTLRDKRIKSYQNTISTLCVK